MCLWGENSWCLGIGIFLLVFVVVFFIQTASAIRINEVELNPAETDAGNEWIELYNDGEIVLDGFKIVNNDGDEIILNGTFSEYYLYIFKKQWLDNSDEKVFLYRNDELIDETSILADNKNNNDSQTYCLGSGWNLVESTKSKENNCGEKQKEESDEEDKQKEEQAKEEDEVDISREQRPEQESGQTSEPEPEAQELEVIRLSGESIINEDDGFSLDLSEEGKTKTFAIAGFVLFMILLIFLFIIKIFRDKLRLKEQIV